MIETGCADRPSVEVSLPKFEFVMPVLGRPKLVRFNRLKDGQADTFNHGNVHVREAWALQNVAAERAERVRGRILKARSVEVFGHPVAFGAVRRQHGIAEPMRSTHAPEMRRGWNGRRDLTSRTYSRVTGDLKGKALLRYLERQPYSLF